MGYDVNKPATPTSSSSVSVTNFPASQDVAVSNFPASQPVTAEALPLPTGAAIEEGNLALIKATVASMLAAMSDGSQVAVSRVQDEFGTQYQILSDNIFPGALLSVPMEHHEIHCGDMFVVSKVTAATNVAATHSILITVPNEAEKRFHLDMINTSTGEGTVALYEDPTGTASGGTVITPRNRHRDSNRDGHAGLSFVYDASGISGGTLIYETRTGPSRATALNRGGEFILKNNSRYYLVWTSNAANNIGTLECNYYFHPD